MMTERLPLHLTQESDQPGHTPGADHWPVSSSSLFSSDLITAKKCKNRKKRDVVKKVSLPLDVPCLTDHQSTLSKT